MEARSSSIHAALGTPDPRLVQRGARFSDRGRSPCRPRTASLRYHTLRARRCRPRRSGIGRSRYRTRPAVVSRRTPSARSPPRARRPRAPTADGTIQALHPPRCCLLEGDLRACRRRPPLCDANGPTANVVRARTMGFRNRFQLHGSAEPRSDPDIRINRTVRRPSRASCADVALTRWLRRSVARARRNPPCAE